MEEIDKKIQYKIERENLKYECKTFKEYQQKLAKLMIKYRITNNKM